MVLSNILAILVCSELTIILLESPLYETPQPNDRNPGSAYRSRIQSSPLAARQNALSTELRLVDAQYGRMRAVVELYRAPGGG